MTSSFADPARIFLAEDNPGSCFLVRQILQEEQIDFLLFSCSLRDAGETLSGQTLSGETSTLPDAILIDVQSAWSETFALLREIRQSEHLTSIPVGVLSTACSLSTQEKLLASGADVYRKKPADGKEVRTAAREILSDLFQAAESNLDLDSATVDLPRRFALISGK